MKVYKRLTPALSNWRGCLEDQSEEHSEGAATVFVIASSPMGEEDRW